MNRASRLIDKQIVDMGFIPESVANQINKDFEVVADSLEYLTSKEVDPNTQAKIEASLSEVIAHAEPMGSDEAVQTEVRHAIVDSNAWNKGKMFDPQMESLYLLLNHINEHVNFIDNEEKVIVDLSASKIKSDNERRMLIDSAAEMIMVDNNGWQSPGNGMDNKQRLSIMRGELIKHCTNAVFPDSYEIRSKAMDSPLEMDLDEHNVGLR